MEERTIKRVALVVMLLGIPGLYVAMAYGNGESAIREDKHKDIGSTGKDSGALVRMTGRVVSQGQFGGLTILKVSQTIPVMIKEPVTVPCGSLIQVDGYYDTYMDEPEFVARSYSIIKEGTSGACMK